MKKTKITKEDGQLGIFFVNVVCTISWGVGIYEW